MTKQVKVLPARRPRDDDSVLLRSAESIGRVIGTLQRQLNGARGRLSALVDGHENTHRNHNGTQHPTKPARSTAAKSSTRKTAETSKKAARTTKSNRADVTTSKRASKSTAARKGTKRARKSS